MPLLGDQLDAVGGQELVVADCARDRTAVGASDQSGLRVVAAVAASLERVDAHRLFARQSLSPGEARIGTLEGKLVGALWRKLKLFGGGAQQVRDDGNRARRFARPLRFFLRQRIDRTFRA